VLALASNAHGEPPSELPWTWASDAASPRTIDPTTLSDREVDLQRVCGRGEQGLRTVAQRMVQQKLRDLPYLDADALAHAQRVAGEPHVWPHGWVVSGRALDHDATRQKLVVWAASFHDGGERRCGVAIAYGADGTEADAAVAVDAEADVAALPIRTRAGAWIPIDARLLVPATGARVVVMGPTGLPRTVPSELHDGRVRAQIALDQPGAFTVQLVADVASGPRPVLEAVLFADAVPWTRMPDRAAPGENAALPGAPEDASLAAMIQAMRAVERLPPLTRDPRLDALALAHAQRMQAARLLAHDVGDGDPSHRMEASGVRPRTSGENVAHAASTVLAHRALYASPSHRSNLLAAAFDRMGVGVVRDADGSSWVAEEFAGGTR